MLFAKNEQTEINSITLGSPKTVKQGFKGKLLKDDKILKHNSNLGEEHPFDANITEGLYKDMGLVTASVDKYIDFLIGPGLFPKSNDPRAVKIIEDWMRDVSFDVHLREWFKEALNKFSGFMELGGDENETVQGVKVLDAKRMFVKRDDKSKVTGYNQIQIGQNMQKFASKEDVVSFKPFQIAQLNINKPNPESAYGLGIIWPVRNSIDSLLENQKSLRTLIKRKANSPIWAKVGIAPNGNNPGQHASESAVSNFGNKMTVLQEKTEFATDERVEMKVLDFGKLGDKFDFPISHDLDMIGTGVQIPDILMGRDVNMAVAPVQMDAFERRMTSIRQTAEKEIENKIWKRVLKANKMDIHVEVEWGQPSKEDVNKRIEQITNLIKDPMLNHNLRKQMEMELAALLGLNVQDVEKADDEREREETELTQPLVPGQNNPKESLKIDSCAHTDEELNKDWTLKEWLDFNYGQYNNDILSIIEKDGFDLLKATTADGIKAGLLDTNEISKLKEVFLTGFEEGKTIREISADLDKNIKFKDRLQLNDKGELKLNKGGNTILSVAAPNRSISIARSETTRLASEGARKNFIKGGLDEYKWVATMSERTCSKCEALNGLVFSLKEATFMPPEHSLCRCTISPVVRDLI